MSSSSQCPVSAQTKTVNTTLNEAFSFKLLLIEQESYHDVDGIQATRPGDLAVKTIPVT